MSASRAKKVKMATKSCPECDQQVGGGPAGGRPLPAAVGCGEAASPGPGLSQGCPGSAGGRGRAGAHLAAVRRRVSVLWPGGAEGGVGLSPSGRPAPVTAAGSGPPAPRAPTGVRACPPGAGFWLRARRPAPQGGFVPIRRVQGPGLSPPRPGRTPTCDKRGRNVMTFSS